jgi:hypothetical protein
VGGALDSRLKRFETDGHRALVSPDESYPPVRDSILLPKKRMNSLMRPRNWNGTVPTALAASLDLYDRTFP